MGCDIHAHLEILKDGESTAKHLGESELGRDYDLFAFMANVRNFYPERGVIAPVSEPRGLPEKLSPQTEKALKFWEDDGHSHSWLSSEELEEVFRRYSAFSPCDSQRLSSLIRKIKRISARDQGKIRLVFWFDC